jgi:GT2 family glycosyltransferase
MRRSVSVLMATFNRPEATDEALDSLAVSSAAAGISVRVFVADASTDDLTARVIRRHFPDASVVPVDRNVYWAQGMRIAWEMARRYNEPEFLLWLNDDVILQKNALSTLLKTADSLPSGGLVGGAMLADSRTISYGGYTRGPVYSRLHFRRLAISKDPQPCDALNGNLLLVSSEVDRTLGGFPLGFTHGMADFAYALKAKKRGVSVVMAPGSLGKCKPNSVGGTWRDITLGRRARLRLLNSAKGIPPAEWFRFCISFGGVAAPAYAVWPWVRVLLAR